VILDVGEWGEVTRLEYAEQAKVVKDLLARKGLVVEIINEVPQSVEGFTFVIFLTRGMLKEAVEMKKANPEKVIILLTGLVVPGDENGGIIPVWKGDVDVFDKILKIVS
jgi:hypothetical protein